MATYIRHDIEPKLVAASIEEAVASNERHRVSLKVSAEETAAAYARAVANKTDNRWPKPPDDPSYIDPMIDKWNAEQRDYYALVRVIERIAEPLEKKRFRLVYGTQPDGPDAQGTGPSATLEESISWFTNQGR